MFILIMIVNRVSENIHFQSYIRHPRSYQVDVTECSQEIVECVEACVERRETAKATVPTNSGWPLLFKVMTDSTTDVLVQSPCGESLDMHVSSVLTEMTQMVHEMT